MADQYVAPAGARPHVLVLGGGVAGITAALELLDRGYAVTLVETGSWGAGSSP